MDYSLESNISTAIENLSEKNFQEFGEYLFKRLYGVDFQTVAPHRDQGCDGILNHQTVVAMYGPQNNRRQLSTFKSKFSSDFRKYKDNWMGYYPEFMFVYNSIFTSSMRSYMNEVAGNIKTIGKDDLIMMIDRLSYPNKKDIVNFLRIPEELFSMDVFEEVIRDLMNFETNSEEKQKISKPTYIVDKIKLNYDESEVEEVINSYDNALPFIRELEEVLKLYPADENMVLKGKIIALYGEFSGPFKQRFTNILRRLTTDRRSRDDIYEQYARVVLLYMFELCIIGKKVKY